MITAANLTAFDWQQNFFFVFSQQLNPGKITRGKDFPDWRFMVVFEVIARFASGYGKLQSDRPTHQNIFVVSWLNNFQYIGYNQICYRQSIE
jgi:hypothetical protein